MEENIFALWNETLIRTQGFQTVIFKPLSKFIIIGIIIIILGIFYLLKFNQRYY